MEDTKHHLEVVIIAGEFSVMFFDLIPGNVYSVGRHKDSDVVLAYPHISRKHGKIFFKDQNWFYQRSIIGCKPKKICHESPIEINRGITLKPAEFYHAHETRIKKKSVHERDHRKILWTWSVVFMLLLLMFNLSHTFLSKKDTVATDLHEEVSKKLVLFSYKKNPEIIKEYKKYGEFSDDEFTSNIGFCTGFIVAKNLVASAAHCLHGRNFINIIQDFNLKTYDDKNHEIKSIRYADYSRDIILFLSLIHI